MKKFLFAILIMFVTQFVFAGENYLDNFNSGQIQYELKVYPNPCTNGKITISASSEDISEITISNIAGQKVLNKEYEFPVQEIKLQLSDMPNGIYLVQVKTTDNKYIVKKLIVSKD